MTEAEIENIKATAVLQAEMKVMKDDLAEIKAAVKELTELRTKGMGAFWLASALFGVGVYLFVTWFRS
jgi:hypothetical protein